MTDFIYSPPMDPWLDIVHRDRDIVVVNKPSGLLSVPGKRHVDSILKRLEGQEERCYAVHRIDMDTSGLQVVALRRAAERELHRQFRERLVQKAYIAVVDGIVSKPNGVIELPLKREGGAPPKSVVDHETGKSAHTEFKVLDHLERRTLILLKPHTGRSHQLRVHMLSLGHPIAGDRIYNPDCQSHERLMLHAYQLAFSHPYSKESMQLACLPLEPYFKTLIENLGDIDGF